MHMETYCNYFSKNITSSQVTQTKKNNQPLTDYETVLNQSCCPAFIPSLIFCLFRPFHHILSESCHQLKLFFWEISIQRKIRGCFDLVKIWGRPGLGCYCFQLTCFRMKFKFTILNKYLERVGIQGRKSFIEDWHYS